MRAPWKWRGQEVDPFRVDDLTERHLDSYLVCLEDWSPEMAEAGDLKARWYERARDKGLRVKLAVDDDDRAIGMIQYVHERARRAAEECDPEVEFTMIDTFDRDTMLRCGRSDEVFVNGRPLQRGAPPSMQSIRRKIAKQARRQRTRGSSRS